MMSDHYGLGPNAEGTPSPVTPLPEVAAHPAVPQDRKERFFHAAGHFLLGAAAVTAATGIGLAAYQGGRMVTWDETVHLASPENYDESQANQDEARRAMIVVGVGGAVVTTELGVTSLIFLKLAEKRRRRTGDENA